MPKIVALDFGLKRIGVAITDDLNIIASGLDTVLTHEIIPFLKDLTNKFEIFYQMMIYLQLNLL